MSFDGQLNILVENGIVSAFRIHGKVGQAILSGPTVSDEGKFCYRGPTRTARSADPAGHGSLSAFGISKVQKEI